MLDESQMSNLRNELIALRDRVLDRKADLEEVEAVTRMANRLMRDMDDERDEPRVRMISEMLEIVRRNMVSQQRLRTAAENFNDRD